ncbi:MAG: hypothetical protein HYY95_03895 [Candidatus Rokubacteria bacterium]|nr:hypothetical protein [Candidatus Rokubacteria bacterium]
MIPSRRDRPAYRICSGAIPRASASAREALKRHDSGEKVQLGERRQAGQVDAERAGGRLGAGGQRQQVMGNAERRVW